MFMPSDKAAVVSERKRAGRGDIRPMNPDFGAAGADLPSGRRAFRSHRFAVAALFLLLPVLSASRQDPVIHTGVNGRLAGPDNALARTEVRIRSPRKTEVHHYFVTGVKWVKKITEIWTPGNNGVWNVRFKGSDAPVITARKYDSAEGGGYRFREYDGGELVRDGFTLLQFPLLLHGAVKEFYPGGTLKSESVYQRNELVSNKNWLKNGESYIDDLFYSADEEPLLSGGDFRLHRHVKEAFAGSGLELSSISGELVLGFVIMEDGSMEGIRVVRGLGSRIDAIAVEALKTLDGKWKPARLNGREVRFFQPFPIRFHPARDTNFDYMELDGPVIHYGVR